MGYNIAPIKRSEEHNWQINNVQFGFVCMNILSSIRNEDSLHSRIPEIKCLNGNNRHIDLTTYL